MSRVISLIILGVFVVLFAVLFFWVMARFMLPLFLAALLAVLFRPLHLWFIRKCRGRDRIAALITSFAIMVIVLAPLLGILLQAAGDAMELVQDGGREVKIDTEGLNKLVTAINSRFGLNLTREGIEDEVKQQVTNWLEPLAQRTPGVVFGFVIGLVVMIVALYYFLADGHDMVQTMGRFLPLDSRHQQQLITEFEKVSRAVVTATLLSAIVQGLLAGIAFQIAGLHSVFLLMMLTVVGAMVPFVGAAAVWGSCAIWLFVAEQRVMAAILLAIYGATIVSTIDNVIKAMVLHGQSKLHPLLALLSVLGGVQALGLIGVFVGPMAVAFLQAGVVMLHAEFQAFDTPNGQRPSIPG